MEHVLVRYGELGAKSPPVERRMRGLLADRVRERLAFEGIDYEVGLLEGRVVARVDGDPREAASAVAELPGVASTSPAVRADPTLDAIAAATDALPVGDTFGVDATTASAQSLSTPEINDSVGAHVGERTGAAVDLDDPETWVGVDVRTADAFVFTERTEGPNGFPVGTQDPVAALVSGGIDSPVAAHAMLTRGVPVVPVYAYNRPYAAPDHVARVEAALDRLRRFHPAGDWAYYRIDMGPVNERLQAVEGGRMLLHRAVLFRVAERVARAAGLAGIVTGESLGQKSSQTAANLAVTAATVDLPVHRPLLTASKERTTQRARELGTFEAAQVNAACRSLAPESPATAMDLDRFESLAAEVDLDSLVETAHEHTELVDL